MAGVLYIEEAKVDANSGHMLLTFTSGGDVFRMHLPRSVAIPFREDLTRNGWPIMCAPDAEVTPLFAGCTDCPRASAKRQEATR